MQFLSENDRANSGIWKEKMNKKIFEIELIILSVFFAFFMLSFFLVSKDTNLVSGIKYGVYAQFLMNKHDSEWTNQGIDLCKDSNLSRYAFCLNKFFNSSYHYVPLVNIRSPDVILAQGGNCVSSANWYFYTLKKAGFSPWFVSEPGHIYTEALIDGQICAFDEGTLNCRKAGVERK
jgi:hypothetical protein